MREQNWAPPRRRAAESVMKDGIVTWRYTDAWICRLYAGTSKVMREIIVRAVLRC